jgi:hypothetical protein
MGPVNVSLSQRRGRRFLKNKSNQSSGSPLLTRRQGLGTGHLFQQIDDLGIAGHLLDHLGQLFGHQRRCVVGDDFLELGAKFRVLKSFAHGFLYYLDSIFRRARRQDPRHGRGSEAAPHRQELSLPIRFREGLDLRKLGEFRVGRPIVFRHG